MKKKKRSQETIAKAKKAILAEADRLTKAGFDVSRRAIVVGGSRTTSVQREWKKRKPDGNIS
jgi:hypothetical protein